jgi:NitT/TauT family transport system substrate-binding protein
MAFMKAYLEGVRMYNDAIVKGHDKDKAIAVIAKYANVKPEIVREAFPAGLDPNQRVSKAFLDKLQTFFVQQHFLRSTVDVSKVVDLSFADAAVKELGPYK